MSNIFLISDTHFGHENIIKYANRPFMNVWDMDEVLIENWNKVVKSQDIVYHLGDVHMYKKSEDATNTLKRLNGRKRLVMGNHDSGQDTSIQRNFQKILMSRAFRDYGCLLTHMPVHPSSLELTKGALVNVHGHIHQNKSPAGLYINVSVEQINYTPVAMEDIEVMAREMLGDRIPDNMRTL